MSSQFKRTPFISLLTLSIFGIILLFSSRLNLNQLKQKHPSFNESNPNFSQFVIGGDCGSWKQVNTNAFGLPSEFDNDNIPIKPVSEKPFQGEEGFEVLVFNDQLYLGMEADNKYGARLWRTRKGITAPQSQLDWEEVAANSDGRPFGVDDTAQVDHIDSLAEFKGWIYVSLANRSGNPQGTLVFRSPSGDPGTWEDALSSLGSGFGKPQNENFKDMQVFDNHLCGGTWNEKNGAEVWCTLDGKNWQQKNISGFGDPQNRIIWSGHVFNDQLYFGVENTSTDGEISQGRMYRTASLNNTPATWEEVFRTPSGISWGNILGDLNNYLYISIPSSAGLLVYRSPSGDPNTWEITNLPGFDNNSENWAILADGATLHQGALYAGVSNRNNNMTVWRTTGEFSNSLASILTWEQIKTEELADSGNIYVQLVSYHGILYAWTSNPKSGQQVWRTICNTDPQELNRDGD